MARPVLETTPAGEELHRRVQLRREWLGALAKDRLSDQQVEELTHGRRGEGDSLHLLVMDLHKGTTNCPVNSPARSSTARMCGNCSHRTARGWSLSCAA